MKFTISDCILRINQALNYPALSYADVSHFFDQAIAELNTSLRISLPTVSEMLDEHTYKITNSSNVVILPATLSDFTIPNVTEVPTEAPSASESKVVYYVPVDSPRLNRSLYIFKDGSWNRTDEAYGIVAGTDVSYEAILVSYSYAVWRSVPSEIIKEFSLTEYLPSDWIILFIIPYVCFKFAVRNGDDGALFSDEFTQGFQQLQTSYNVPNNVQLFKVAHIKTYSKLVEENINDLTKFVNTRTITEGMKITNGIKKVYGENLYDSGGWGI